MKWTVEWKVKFHYEVWASYCSLPLCRKLLFFWYIRSCCYSCLLLGQSQSLYPVRKVVLLFYIKLFSAIYSEPLCTEGMTHVWSRYWNAPGLMSIFLRLNWKTLWEGSNRGLQQIDVFIKTVQTRSAAYWLFGNNYRPWSINSGGNYVSDRVISIFKQQTVTILIGVVCT